MIGINPERLALYMAEDIAIMVGLENPLMFVLIEPDGDLKIACSEATQRILQEEYEEDADNFNTLDTMYRWLESVVTEYSYEWTEPVYCHALTGAPMLARYADSRRLLPGEDVINLHVVGSDLIDGEVVTFVEDVDACWGYMDYAVRLPQEDLMRQGFCIFSFGGP